MGPTNCHRQKVRHHGYSKRTGKFVTKESIKTETLSKSLLNGRFILVSLVKIDELADIKTWHAYDMCPAGGPPKVVVLKLYAKQDDMVIKYCHVAKGMMSFKLT